MIPHVMPTYARAPMTFVKGEGSWLMDKSGERWLDAGGGIAVNILGHAHPRLTAALTEQAQRLWHTSNLYHIEEQELLAARLVEMTFADTVFFTNSGAEACEAAIKVARRHWYVAGHEEKTEIITLSSSFHGRTWAMISASGNEKHISGFAPLAPGFVQVPPNDIDAVQGAVSSQTAAIMVEPVIGEGGIVPLSDGFLKQLRVLCDTHGLLLILDEVQCGMGRTGKLFAHEWAGISPDIMTIAKGIGGGFPLGACLAKSDAAKGMTAGTHGSTYGGNPLACRIGREVLDIVSKNEFLDDVRRRAGFLRQRLESVTAEHPRLFRELRGTGLMLGLVCRGANSPVIAAAHDQRLLLVPAGGDVIRILPPLNMDEAELRQVCDRISAAARQVEMATNA
ncbi:MAG: aspartate aminotransferase family protein [Rhodobacteraceae bacterium]|nr:aspartate aminotransferase family protein [Paracoccaceae bacterium]